MGAVPASGARVKHIQFPKIQWLLSACSQMCSPFKCHFGRTHFIFRHPSIGAYSCIYLKTVQTVRTRSVQMSPKLLPNLSIQTLGPHQHARHCIPPDSACRCVHADKLINVDACTIMYLNNLISMDRYRSVYIETVKATSTFYHCRIHTKFVPSSCIVCPRDVDSMCQDAVPQEFAAEFLQRGVAAVPRFSPSEYF